MSSIDIIHIFDMLQLLRALHQLQSGILTIQCYTKAMDVWSYGCFLFWLLTRQNMFENEAEAETVLLNRTEYDGGHILL